MAGWLEGRPDPDDDRAFRKQRASLGRKHFVGYFAASFKEILRQCERHGIDHRTPMNQTPLIAAATAGNVPLVEALLGRGANVQLTDHLGRNALHWAMLEAFTDPKFARGPFAALYPLIAPTVIDVRAGDRLVRIDRHLSEYFLFQTIWALFKSRFTIDGFRGHSAFDTATLIAAWQYLPNGVLRPERRKRAYLSGLLSRNEVDRDYTYNWRLFTRLAQGRYQFNPALALRRRDPSGESWVGVLDALNLRFIAQGAHPDQLLRLNYLLVAAGQDEAGTPIGAEKFVREIPVPPRLDQAGIPSRVATKSRAETAGGAVRVATTDSAATATSQSDPAPTDQKARPPAPWGSPRARREEIERIRRDLARKKAERAARDSQ